MINLNETSIKKELGKQLKAYRKKMDWTQKELANKLGFKSDNSIYKWEQGNMDIDKFEEALKTIGVTKISIQIVDHANDFELD